MADAVSRAGVLPRAAGSSFAAPLLLIAVGSLIAAAVALSKLAASAGAPMLGYLGAVWIGAGVILAVPVLVRRGTAGLGGPGGGALWVGVAATIPVALERVAVFEIQDSPDA
ncbi:MAG: hypothetical protein WBB85_19035 [Albidovulum sp.]|uniref:hypothetical protein n=1 Tax=Albidovulum sp. TaxID=1872424 RepID=UPI003C8D123C